MNGAIAAPASDRGKPLRVCHVIDALRFGGAERQFVEILNALDGVERYAAILRDQGPGTGLWPELDRSVETVSMMVRIRFAPLHILRLAGWFRARQIDVVHCHMFWPSFFGTLAARLAGTPVVVTTDHGTSPWKRPMHYLVERMTVNRAADRRLAVSSNVARVMRERAKLAPGKIGRVFNGTRLAPALNLQQRSPVRLCAVGRFVWQKDYRTLLEAVGILKRDGIDAVLSIAGDGPLRVEMEQKASAIGIADRVRFCGLQGQIGEWLSQQDIFVLSSVEEGQPVAVLEAMARGLPVVATKVGGVPDTVRDGVDGVLVETGRPAPLAEAIRRLIADFPLRCRLGRSAHERIKATFSTEVLAEQHLTLYREILQRKGRLQQARPV